MEEIGLKEYGRGKEIMVRYGMGGRKGKEKGKVKRMWRRKEGKGAWRRWRTGLGGWGLIMEVVIAFFSFCIAGGGEMKGKAGRGRGRGRGKSEHGGRT